VLQAALFSPVEVFGGSPDLLLVTLVAVALLHGALAGTVAGFAAGLLLDVAYLAPLGVSSLAYMLVGFWAGRYGETTGRDRRHAQLLSVIAFTLVFAVARYALEFTLGEDVSASRVFLEALVPSVVMNVALAVPVFAVARRHLRPADTDSRVREVRLLG
jgi:rod shape-determining protein MreD